MTAHPHQRPAGHKVTGDKGDHKVTGDKGDHKVTGDKGDLKVTGDKGDLKVTGDKGVKTTYSNAANIFVNTAIF